MVATRFVLPRRYPHLRKTFLSGFLPVIGALGAIVVIVLALWPGTSLSLVWPGEYLILVVWIVIGLILWFTTKPMSQEDALGALLGPFKSELDANLAQATEQEGA